MCHDGLRAERKELPPQAVRPQQKSFSGKGKIKAFSAERKLRLCHQPRILTEWL